MTCNCAGSLSLCEVSPGEVVTPHEAAEAHGTGEPLLPCVGPSVAGQLVGASQSPLAALPLASKVLLPCVCPQVGLEVGALEVGTNMVEYLEQAESSRSCPFMLPLQDGMLCSQAFVVISGKAIETETALAAVDTCFKSFYVFDIKLYKSVAMFPGCGL
ncbi:hypothetical protein KUCAC02_035115 [Chaenocephalus aceratus]|nr:hypothetical protein KUCAC02_035115 [Chaenocephalus aceratus]